jgi:uncharacterized protein (TIGR02147 family)
MKIPSVYAYNDFRRYLSDWQKVRKESDPPLTGAEIHARLGLPKTRSFLADVIAGKSITSAFVERFVQLLELGRDEAQFFRTLVRFNQASHAEERELAFDQLVALNRTPRTVLGEAQREYFRHWWIGAVRALLDTGDYTDDPGVLAKALMPKVTPGQVRKALEVLRELGLIGSDARGFWKPTEAALSTPDHSRDELVLGLQLQHLGLLEKSLLQPRTQEQMSTTNLVSVSHGMALQIRQKLEKVRAEIRSMTHKDPHPAQDVCLIQLSFLPLTRSQEKTP